MTSPQRMPAPKSVEELRVRAEALAGRSVAELAEALGMAVPAESSHSKGFVGQLVERALGADPTAGDRPDFSALGIELKTVPVDDAGNPIETTFCCSINAAQAESATWESSRLYRKLQHVLWIPIAFYQEPARRTFGEPVFWQPTAQQWDTLRRDWEDHMGAIASGEVPSGTLGHVLQVRPKGQNAQSRVVGVGPDGAGLTRPLAFYLRTAFTRGVIRT